MRDFNKELEKLEKDLEETRKTKDNAIRVHSKLYDKYIKVKSEKRQAVPKPLTNEEKRAIWINETWSSTQISEAFCALNNFRNAKYYKEGELHREFNKDKFIKELFKSDKTLVRRVMSKKYSFSQIRFFRY
tara:strand:+ start:130 stop:522 length:393 start_codon:yes stop_codon:yes gene_type:complete